VACDHPDQENYKKELSLYIIIVVEVSIYAEVHHSNVVNEVKAYDESRRYTKRNHGRERDISE
jgi:hypothetical protein